MSAMAKALIDGADRLFRAVNPHAPRLDAAGLLDTAERRYGVNLAPQRRVALQLLLEAAEGEAELSFFGRHALRWDLCRMLRNGGKVEQSPAADGAGKAALASPIFILGLPRTGSTFLHRLLAEDHDNMVLRCWQALEPAPRPCHFDPLTDARARRAERMLAGFGSLAPDLAPLHPLGADLPQECSEITAHTFHSLAFDTILRVPSYRDWLDRRGHHEAYRFHRRFLRFLHNGVSKRWVLKCPDHVFALDALLEVYPDARLIITHRDPVAVIASVARLTEVLRQPFSRHVDPRAVGTEVAGRWSEGAQRLVALDRCGLVPPERIFHLHYAEFVADPVDALRRIYHHFGIALAPVASQRMRALVQSQPRGGYGRNQYSLDSFGLDGRALDRAFAGYRSHFGIGPRASQLKPQAGGGELPPPGVSLSSRA